MQAMYVQQMDNLKQDHGAEVNHLKTQHMKEVQELLVSQILSNSQNVQIDLFNFFWNLEVCIRSSRFLRLLSERDP